MFVITGNMSSNSSLMNIVGRLSISHGLLVIEYIIF